VCGSRSSRFSASLSRVGLYLLESVAPLIHQNVKVPRLASTAAERERQMLTALAADFRFSLLSVGLVVDRWAVRPVAELPPRFR
jgi:hypothetical protein